MDVFKGSLISNSPRKEKEREYHGGEEEKPIGRKNPNQSLSPKTPWPYALAQVLRGHIGNNEATENEKYVDP